MLLMAQKLPEVTLLKSTSDNKEASSTLETVVVVVLDVAVDEDANAAAVAS